MYNGVLEYLKSFNASTLYILFVYTLKDVNIFFNAFLRPFRNVFHKNWMLPNKERSAKMTFCAFRGDSREIIFQRVDN